MSSPPRFAARVAGPYQRVGKTNYYVGQAKLSFRRNGREAHLRRPLRDRARARPRGRALGAPGRARAAARPQALHRPPRRAAPRGPRRARSAAARVGGGGGGGGGGRARAPPAGSRVYELTERGQELEPVVLALGRWGSVAPFPPGEADFGVDAFVLALKTLFDPAAVDGLRGRYALRLGEQSFRA